MARPQPKARWRLPVAAALTLLASSCAHEPPVRPIVFSNGDIVTMTASPALPGSSPEAVLVSDGRIARIGSQAEVLEAAGPETLLVDLQGRTLMPGFVEPHTHPDLHAFLRSLVDLGGEVHGTPQEVWATFEAAVAAAEEGQWVFAKGYDPWLVEGLEPPTLEYLDRVAPDNPVFILAQNLHWAWVNTRGLEAAGITPKTPDPSESSYYEKDADGKLTGYIHEVDAVKRINDIVLEEIDLTTQLAGALDDYLAQGITTIASTGVFGADSGALLAWEHLSAEEPGLLSRAAAFLGFLPGRRPAPRHFVYLLDDDQDLLPDSPENGDDSFRVLGVKFWYDSSIMVAGEGELTYTQEEFREKARAVHRKGWQIAVHVHRDWAITEVLDHLDAAIAEHPRTDHRHRIEHGTYVTPALLERMRESGLTISFLLSGFRSYADALSRPEFGFELEKAYPAATAEALGVVYSFHTDAPAFVASPLALVQTAITRTTRHGTVFGAEEAVSVEEGLRAVTTDAAWQLRMEEAIGSIEVGKYADLVVLDRNPLKVEAEELEEIRVEATYVGGRQAYDAAGRRGADSTGESSAGRDGE